VLEFRQPLEGANEAVLHDIEGILGPAGNPQRDAIGHVAKTLK
jgi:hypothetical protein